VELAAKVTVELEEDRTQPIGQRHGIGNQGIHF